MVDIASVIQNAAAANGVDPDILSRIAQIESGLDPNAAASGSSAKGLFQFTNPTWKQYGNGADPLDPAANADAGARLLRDNSTALATSGIEASPANVYLAHFSGIGGAKKVLSADPGAPVASVLGDDAVAANPFLKNMTAAGLAAWANRKMAGDKTAAAPSAAPVSQVAPARPGILNTAPAHGGGILNGGEDDGLGAFRNQLAALSAQQQQQPAPPALAPISFAMPRGLPRAKLLAALSQPLGG